MEIKLGNKNMRVKWEFGCLVGGMMVITTLVPYHYHHHHHHHQNVFCILFRFTLHSKLPPGTIFTVPQTQG